MAARTVIVGGVAAGMSAATRLRRNDERRDIIVLERGEHVSFANCGLPYHIGGVIPDRDELLLQTPESLAARFAIDVRTRQKVVSIDKGARTVTVRCADGEYKLAYDDLVLATGAAPVRPPIPGIERAYALRDVADMDEIVDALAGGSVRQAVVIGAGFIGLELAENLTRRGHGVTIVEVADQVLPPLDPEMAALVRRHVEAAGVGVVTGVGAAAIESDAIVLTDGTRLPADLVLLAAGVAPESQLAREAGLELGFRGGIAVDEVQRTSDPHIYAVGDVAVKRDAVSGDDTLVPLAQTANRHGRLVADAITGRRVHSLPVLGTAVVGVLGLTVAMVGWSEKRLRTAGRPVRVIHTHPYDHATYYPGAEQLALKLLVDPATDEILGAQGVGSNGVEKRIDVIATAMRGGLRASDLADLELAYAPQYGSAKDPVNLLGMIADNLAAGAVATVQWHEVADELAQGAVLLDVRDTGEASDEPLPWAVNIPLDQLRERHAELPAGRLLVTCAVGQRGNTAVRLLRQLGHSDVVNLDGGYRTWSTATAA